MIKLIDAHAGALSINVCPKLGQLQQNTKHFGILKCTKYIMHFKSVKSSLQSRCDVTALQITLWRTQTQNFLQIQFRVVEARDK